MSLIDFFTKKEALVSIDIGASCIRMLELDISQSVPVLMSLGVERFQKEVFSNNEIHDQDYVAECLDLLLERCDVQAQRAVISMPGPSIFVKKLKLPKTSVKELESLVEMEAGSLIPHNIDDVMLDFHVIGEGEPGQLDILIVAAKNETIDSFMDCFTELEMEPVVVDIDYFALQNCFELGYASQISDTVALINIGARYSCINVVRNGQSLTTGDVPVGGNLITAALVDELGFDRREAESMKRAYDGTKIPHPEIPDVVEGRVDYITAELNRQLSLLWSASGEDGDIDRIMIAGGSSKTPGLLEQLQEKTGIECVELDPLKGVRCADSVDASLLKSVESSLALAIGSGIRFPGDKEYPEGVS
ncbi:MAG: type IV pilus assembly protein PilM [Bdellovibrionales bacterium]|nr:type IV pilus assembly protein PilM [Bdellovibrionales bacterium]